MNQDHVSGAFRKYPVRAAEIDVVPEVSFLPGTLSSLLDDGRIDASSTARVAIRAAGRKPVFEMFKSAGSWGGLDERQHQDCFRGPLSDQLARRCEGR